MNQVFGDIQITDEYAEELAREWRAIGDTARAIGGYSSGELIGFESLATKLGIMPAIKRADERIQRRGQ